MRHCVQADVRCMRCGRMIGSLLAFAEPFADRLDPTIPRLTFFKSSALGSQTRRLRGGERFKCAACGGSGIIEDIEPFATELISNQDDGRPRPGRRPKPWLSRGDWRLE